MKDKIIGRGLSFDDVLLVQQVSDIDSRYDPDMDLSTEVAKGAPKINIPLVSANMDTVTESEMAIAVAQYGGLGVIHRFNTPKQQAEEIRIVKAQMAIIEKEPITIPAGATVADAQQMLEKRKRGYVIVVLPDGKPGEFVGIATSRDFKFGDKNDPITNVMTPLRDLFSVPEGTTLEQAVSIMKAKRVEKIPVVRNDGTLAGVYTLKDDEMLHKYPNAAKDALGRLLVAAAIGIKDIDIDRAHQLEAAGADILVLDVAHGGMRRVAQIIHLLKVNENIKTPIVAGNVSTEETVRMLVDSGADGVKVGVGPGLVCTTRDIAGAGMPQITAIQMAVKAMENLEIRVPIIADGGIRKPGDVSKAIGIGADSVMIGSYIAGAIETPGEVEMVNGQLYKVERGMASADAHATRLDIEGENKDSKLRVPEGRKTYVPIQGPVAGLLKKLEGGLRSGMSYSGAFTIPEMQEKGMFVEVSVAGANEQRRELNR